MIYLYRIRNKEGLYSNANILNFEWQKNGFIFTSKDHLTVHLKSVITSYLEHPEVFDYKWLYKDCTIDRYQIDELEKFFVGMENDLTSQINSIEEKRIENGNEN